MVTVTLELDDKLFAVADQRAKREGADIRQVLHWYVEAFSEGQPVDSMADVLAWAESRGFFVRGTMPPREERVAR